MEKIQRIVARLTRKTPAGLYVHTAAEVRHVIPLLVLELCKDATTLDAETRAIVAAAWLKAGIVPSMRQATILARLQLYYAQFPPKKAIITEIAAELRDATSPQSFHKVLGLTPSKFTPQQGNANGHENRSTPHHQLSLRAWKRGG